LQEGFEGHIDSHVDNKKRGEAANEGDDKNTQVGIYC
jgi:hypothetical protein